MNSIIKNTLAGITTSLAMVPEVVAFAILATVNPLVGLYAAVILGLVTAVFGGRPGLISGGAGSMAVVSVALVVSHGEQYLFACIVLTGLLQILFGIAKLGKLIKLVSPSIMTGFVNGLALIIFFAQFEQFKIGEHWLQGAQLYTTMCLVALTVAVVVISAKYIKQIPASLIGIVATALVAILFNLDTRYVRDIADVSGTWPTFAIPAVPLDLETLQIIAPYSFLLAIIGLFETLLTANLVDQHSTNPNPSKRARLNQESVAQGVGNSLTGFFGGMGGCAMIGQTVINLEAGGWSRLSGVVSALAILCYILFASPLIENIPLAGLVGVMVVVCYHTIDWASLKNLHTDFIMVLVMLITVVFNLAYAICIGIVVTALMYYWEHAKQHH